MVPSRKRSRQNGEDDADLIINSGDEGYSGFQDVGRGEIGQFAGNVTVCCYSSENFDDRLVSSNSVGDIGLVDLVLNSKPFNVYKFH